MASTHQHTKQKELEGKKLLFTVLLNFVITLAEIIGGLLSNSLALISDAIHNLSDTIALLITYITHKISKKPSDKEHTFGYKRIQILAALFNAVTLIAICIYLLYEAYTRFVHPEPVKSKIMLIVAVIGLVANLVSVLLLKGHSKENLNIKAAYLHLIGDTLSSVAVIVGGVLIYYFEVYWVDPLITVLISLYIIKETYSVLYETYNILMQHTPGHVSVEEMVTALVEIPEIENVHHVHVWNLTDTEIYFEAHLNLIDDIKISESQAITDRALEILKNKFNINHVTLQSEHNRCDDKSVISDENCN